MSKELRKRRIIAGIVVIAMCFLSLAGVLVKTQLIDGEKYKTLANSLSESTVIVKASRGEILGCNGEPLVTNRQGNSLVFKYSEFPSADKQQERNTIIFALICLFEEYDIPWIDRLPVVYEDGALVIDEDKSLEFEYMVGENMLELEKGENSTAEECLNALIERYGLSSYSKENARKIASVCFGMKYLSFSTANAYTFAEDVPTEIVSMIKEKSASYPGVDTESVSYREYSDTMSFSHLLGVVGSISSEEYSKEAAILEELLNDDSLTATEITEIKNNAYALDDEYGKSGIERAMEHYLRGKNGIKSVVAESDGSITEEYIIMPEQGNTVVTTIDPGLQKVCLQALEDMLADNKNSYHFESAGAIVVLDCNTGAVLASVSLPTYDITTYFTDYDDLVSDKTSPLWDRSLQSAYAPGSTMKPAIALAALEEGIIDITSCRTCNGSLQISDQSFGCLANHGTINVTTGLQKSCNIFFFEMGRELGIDKMNKYCSLLGLGQKTGIELPEAEGMLASIANKEANGQVWNPGDTVQAAIGQSDNLFTPIQLANYAATIANGGTRYQPYVIKSVLSADMSEIIYETEPTILNTLNVSQENLDIVKQGMRQVMLEGSSIYFDDCIVEVAGKTGTSQVMRTTESGVTMKCNNGFFISFAPYDDPQIAVAVVAENALTGSRTSQAAADVYNYYFGQRTNVDEVVPPNTLIG